MRDVCLAVSLPYNFVIDPAGVNGTGIRFVIQQAASYFGNLQTIIIDGGLNRVYSWVIAKQIKNGKLKGPNGDVLPWDCNWTRPASITIDPTRVSNTEISLLEAGLLNRQNFWSQRGIDWKSASNQWLDEIDYLVAEAKRRGLPVELVLRARQGAPAMALPENDGAAIDKEEQK